MFGSLLLNPIVFHLHDPLFSKTQEIKDSSYYKSNYCNGYDYTEANVC